MIHNYRQIESIKAQIRDYRNEYQAVYREKLRMMTRLKLVNDTLKGLEDKMEALANLPPKLEVGGATIG